MAGSEGAEPPPADVAGAGRLPGRGRRDERLHGRPTGLAVRVRLVGDRAAERLPAGLLDLLLNLQLRPAARRLDALLGLSLELDRLLAQPRLGLGSGAGLRLLGDAVGEPADLLLGLPARLLGRLTHPALQLPAKPLDFVPLSLGRPLGPLLG